MHLILANPPWRQLQERAEKTPGDKKHVKGILSQSQGVAQFNSAQNRLPEPVAASLENVQNGAVSQMGIVVFCPSEKERSHA